LMGSVGQGHCVPLEELLSGSAPEIGEPGTSAKRVFASRELRVQFPPLPLL
jgi:hypothetical protein